MKLGNCLTGEKMKETILITQSPFRKKFTTSIVVQLKCSARSDKSMYIILLSEQAKVTARSHNLAGLYDITNQLSNKKRNNVILPRASDVSLNIPRLHSDEELMKIE